MHNSIIEIDSIPAVIESKESILFIRKKSINAKMKNRLQIGSIAFFIQPLGIA